MKIPLAAFFTLFTLNSASAQSPFNYGQNKKVYFISTEQRSQLEMNSIISVDQLPENETGGMGENWEVTIISFYENSISDDWYPSSHDSTFQFDLDSLISPIQFLNGTRFEFSNGELVAYGGGGYGAFDWIDFYRFDDSVSIGERSCVGHCGNQPVNYSKNVFNPQGQLIYTVFYPTPGETEESFEGETPLPTLETLLTSKVTPENLPDTLIYRYDKMGLLLNTSKENHIQNKKEALLLFSHSPGQFEFHQCYVGNREMEKFFSDELGYTPRLILIEIYRQGVFAFTLNPADKKYYRSNDFVMER